MPRSTSGSARARFRWRVRALAKSTTGGRCFLSLRDLSGVRRLTHDWSTAERSAQPWASRLAACSRRSQQRRTGPSQLNLGAGGLSSSDYCSSLLSRSLSRSGNRVRTPAQVENPIPRPPHERASSSSRAKLSRVLYQVTHQPLASTRNELPPRSLATKVLSALCFSGGGRLADPADASRASVHSSRSRNDFAQWA